MKELGLLMTVVVPLILFILQQLAKQGARPAPPSLSPPPPLRVRPRPARPVKLPVTRPRRDSHLEDLRRQFTQLAEEAVVTAREARVARATTGFASTLEDHVARRAEQLGRDLSAGQLPPAVAHQALLSLRLVQDQVERFLRQRRDPDLLHPLGDADTLAIACYEPLIEFARSRGLGLTSARPAVELWKYDLATWTGFLPTGLAPIFLPPDFFQRLAWWPALAHEIGHDFLAAVPGLEDRLREELDLPGEEEGRIPLRMSGDGLHLAELVRVYGGWFEELFCDVFGTLMLGPAYLYSMTELFAEPDNPVSLLVARRQPDGLHDPHPPRQLRVLLCVHVLEQVQLGKAAQEVLTEWQEAHGGLPEVLYFPVQQRFLGLDLAPVLRIGQILVERLCNDQLAALDGFQLRSIPGVDFGPAQQAATERARTQLLARQVPTVRDVRALVAGAVLARRARPAQEAELVLLARRAILAFGTTESYLDAYSPAGPLATGTGEEDEREQWRRRFLLQTVLGPPLALARRRVPFRPGAAPR